MSAAKAVSSSLSAFVALSWPLAALAGPARCVAPDIGTKRAPRMTPPLEAKVIGAGRLYFYSAPDARCPIAGLFVVPRDLLVVYSQTQDGWSSVVYFDGESGDDSGWVRSARLKTLGTIAPKP